MQKITTVSSARMFVMIGKIIVRELPDYANQYVNIMNEGGEYDKQKGV